YHICIYYFFFFFQAEDGIRDLTVTGVQTCALPIYSFAMIAYYMQALTQAIMAKESGGHFYVDVDDKTVTGNQGLDQTVRELYSRSEERRVGKECRFGWWEEH